MYLSFKSMDHLVNKWCSKIFWERCPQDFHTDLSSWIETHQILESDAIYSYPLKWMIIAFQRGRTIPSVDLLLSDIFKWSIMGRRISRIVMRVSQKSEERRILIIFTDIPPPEPQWRAYCCNANLLHTRPSYNASSMSHRVIAVRTIVYRFLYTFNWISWRRAYCRCAFLKAFATLWASMWTFSKAGMEMTRFWMRSWIPYESQGMIRRCFKLGFWRISFHIDNIVGHVSIARELIRSRLPSMSLIRCFSSQSAMLIELLWRMPISSESQWNESSDVWMEILTIRALLIFEDSSVIILRFERVARCRSTFDLRFSYAESRSHPSITFREGGV